MIDETRKNSRSCDSTKKAASIREVFSRFPRRTMLIAHSRHMPYCMLPRT